MRRLIPLLLLVTASFPTSTHAQRMWVGGRLGIATSTLGGQYGELADIHSRTTFSATALFGAKITRALALQPELAYVAKGVTGNDEAASFTVDLRYLELNLPLVVSVPIPALPVRPRAYTGPALAIELDCTFTSRDPGAASESRTCGYQDPFNVVLAFTETSLLDLGWSFGAGLDIPVGPGAITADVRYTVGLSDINACPGCLSIKNRSLQALAGYVFHFGGTYQPPRRFPDRGPGG